MKSKHENTVTNTYGWQTPPSTPQSQALDAQIAKYDTPDPTIPYVFNNRRNQLNNRFDNPFGFNYSPEVQEAQKYARGQELDQAQGQAHREDNFNRMNAKTAALAGSAALHAPVLTQTGGHEQGFQTTPWGPALIGAAGQIGGAALG